MAYKPTERSARAAYNKLNKAIFESKLPPASYIDFDIGEIPMKWWAYCEYNKITGFKIKLLPEYVNRDFFIAILAHEMVHVWEQLTYSRMTHGPNFFSFKDVFELNDIELTRCYDHEDFV